MPVLAWHALSGNHEVVELLLQQDLIEVNAEFDGIDDQGNMMDLFTVSFIYLLVHYHKI